MHHQHSRIANRRHTTGNRRLHRLARLRKHCIVPGEDDIRGWLVLTDDGQRVGRVHDVIVDIVTLHVRHVELALDPHFTGAQPMCRAVVPIACARVSAQRKHVNIRGLTSGELACAPRYGARPIGPEEDGDLRRFFLRKAASARSPVHAIDDERQELEREHDRFWGIRRRGREREPYVCRATKAEKTR